MSATSPAPARKPVLSKNTLLVGAALVALFAAYGVLNPLVLYSDTASTGAYNAVYLFGTALQPLFATVIIAVAIGIGVKENVGKQWLLIGGAVAAYAIGDIAWAIIELGMGLDPYPSVADVFYFLEYAFFFAAVVLAIRSYAGLTKIRTPLLVSGVVALASLGAVYAFVLAPYILPAGVEELGFWGMVVSVGYPVCDVLFMVGPAIALALVIRQLGAGRLAWPWWLIATSALVFAAADTAYSYADWAGTGTSTLLDLGWLASNLLMALAALVARDVFRRR